MRYTAQKMKFSIKGFSSKYDQIRSFLRIWSHLLEKSLMENFIFCVVTLKVIQSLLLLISYQIRFSSCVKIIWVFCTCFVRIKTLVQFGGPWPKYSQILWRYTWKVILSLQFYVSHQIRFCSSVNALLELSYTCFTNI